MKLGVGEKILTTLNDRVPLGLSEIYSNNLGTNIWLLDVRRWFGNYRVAQPASGTNINKLNPALSPVDVFGVSTFIQPANNYYPIFSKNTYNCDCLYVWNVLPIDSGNIASTTNNTTNGATSLTAYYRIRLEGVNTNNNIGLITAIQNNTGTATRLNIGFDNQFPYNSALYVGLGNQDVAGELFYGTYNLPNLRLSDFYNKWTTFIVDINYVSRLLRIWINGKLVLSVTTGLTSGALPNTTSKGTNVLSETNYTWTGYCSYARLMKNGTITNDDAMIMHNLMEYATLTN